MKTKEKRVTGLYIGPKLIDLVQLEKTAAGPKLVGFAREEIIERRSEEDEKKDIPKNKDGSPIKRRATDENPSHIDNATIIQAMKRAIRKSNLKVEEAVVNLPLENAMIRYFQMPLIPEQEWQTAIKFEAKRHIPFSIKDIFFDFQVTKKEEEKRMDVVFAAAQKKEVQKIISDLAQIDIKVLVLEPISSSVNRILQLNNQIDPNQSTVIVNIIGDNANVNILKNNIFYFVRDIKMTQEEKEKSCFDNLLNEIRLSFNYYEKKLKQEKIDKIILCSDEEIEPRLIESFKENFKINVELGEVAKGLVNAEGLASGFCFATGLGLKGIASSALEVNLWQQEELIKKKASEKENFVKTVIVEGILAILILGGVFFISNNQLKTAKDELDKVINQRPKVSAEMRGLNIPQLKSRRESLSRKNFTFKKIIGKRIFLTAKLNELNKILPEGVWIKELTWNENTPSLILKGSVFLGDKQKETEVVTNLVSVIQRDNILNEGFKKPPRIGPISQSDKRGHKITDFEITME